MLLREQLVSDFAGIILGCVRNNGWLTDISENVGINRKEFNRKKFSSMQLHRVLRIVAGLAWKMSWYRFSIVWMKLGELIFKMGDQQFYELCDEKRDFRKKRDSKKV